MLCLLGLAAELVLQQGLYLVSEVAGPGKAFFELASQARKRAVAVSVGRDVADLASQVLGLLGTVCNAPLGDLEEGILDEGAVQLRLTVLALGEGDWYLAYVPAILDSAESQVNLEDVASLRQVVEVNGLQQLTRKCAVACGHVGQAGAQRHGDVQVAQAGQVLAGSRPVDGLAARYVAGTDDEVRALVDLSEEQVQLLRCVGTVSVHLTEDLVVALQAPLEASNVST